MNRFDSAFLAVSSGGELRGKDFVAMGIEKDTRRDLAGRVYVALVGERFDGHRFVADALARGAVGAIVDRAHAAAIEGAPLLVVEDCGQALLDIASAHLARLPARRVALTGSNGKTTTKEMIAAICRVAVGSEAVVATAGNLNNLIGLPLTACTVTEQTSIAVLEMGMNRPGEIAAMAAAVRPQIGLITNVHPAHLEGLGDVEGVARAKGELFASLTSADTAAVNLEDAFCPGLAEHCRARQVRYGRSSGAEVELVRTRATATGQVVELLVHGMELSAELSLGGVHNALNATAAAAVATALGLPLTAIAEGLAATRPIAGRLNLSTVAGVQIIDDTYNANPASMWAALRFAADRSQPGTLLVALGEMRELGSESAQLHRELGALVAGVTPRQAWFCGAHAEDCRSGAEAAGLGAAQIATADDVAELTDRICATVREGDLFLVKGSRGARMERLVQALGGRKVEGR